MGMVDNVDNVDDEVVGDVVGDDDRGSDLRFFFSCYMVAVVVAGGGDDDERVDDDGNFVAVAVDADDVDDRKGNWSQTRLFSAFDMMTMMMMMAKCQYCQRLLCWQWMEILFYCDADDDDRLVVVDVEGETGQCEMMMMMLSCLTDEKILPDYYCCCCCCCYDRDWTTEDLCQKLCWYSLLLLLLLFVARLGDHSLKWRVLCCCCCCSLCVVCELLVGGGG